MPARTDGRWTMTMMTRTDCPCVRLSVREARASVGRFGTSRSFVRRGTERAGRVVVVVGEDVVFLVVVSSGLLVFKSKSNSFLRCGDDDER